MKKRTDAQAEAASAMLAALELAQSHIGWCWDKIEENTRLRREGSGDIHARLAAAIAQAEAAGIK